MAATPCPPGGHLPIPDEHVTAAVPPATVPIVATIGYRCIECGQPCEWKEPT